MNTNTENKQTEINNSHTKTNNPNQQQRGAFDDLKDVFRISENDKNQKIGDVIIIKKSWRGHILPVFILLLSIKGFFPDLFILSFIAIFFLLDQFIRVFSSRLEINIVKKEAKVISFYGTHIVKNIQSISLDKDPFALFAKSIGVAGLNDGVGLSSIRYSKEVEELVNSFDANFK